MLKNSIFNILQNINLFTKQNKNLIFLVTILNIVAYFYFHVHYLMHNHAPKLWFSSSATRYEYLSKLIGNIFYNNANLPFILPLFFSFTSSVLAVYLINCWSENTKISFVEKTLIALVITLLPMNLVTYYYSYATGLHAIYNFLIIFIIYLFREKNFFSNFVLFALLIAVCFTNTLLFTKIIVIINSLILSEILFKKIFNFKKILLFFISLVLSFFIFKFYLSLQSQISYALETKNVLLIFNDLYGVFLASFRHLLISQPDILRIEKNLLLILTCLGFFSWGIFLLIEKKWRLFVLFILFSLGILLSTKLTSIISTTNINYQYRYNLGLTYFYGFSAFLSISIFAQFLKKYVNFKYIIICILIFLSFKFIQSNLLRQKVLYIGQQHDLFIMNRVINRIEQLPELNLDKKYRFVMINDFSRGYRLKLLKKPSSKKWDLAAEGHMDRGNIFDIWTNGAIFKYLGSNVKVLGGYNPKFKEDIKYIKEKYPELMKFRWPHKKSVFIEDDKIVVIF